MGFCSNPPVTQIIPPLFTSLVPFIFWGPWTTQPNPTHNACLVTR